MKMKANPKGETSSPKMKLTDLTILKTHEGLQKKDFSAVELCQTYLNEIKEKNKIINAFLTVTEELALSQAKETDEKLASGEEINLLAGIPCVIKDNILVEETRCTAASKVLENYIAPYDATVVKKLRGKGAVVLGKANLDEFAMGASGENSAFGPTKNPRDLSRVPGGSSSGPAAAVAANMAVYAIGSDTAGSIRYPASFCGLVGLRPTYGAVSRYGLIAMASSLDTVGPLTKNVEDCQTIFDAIKGKDPLDSTSVENNLEPKAYNLKTIKIGVPKEYFIKGMDEGVEKLIRSAIKKYETLGARIEEVTLPHTEYSIAAYYIITPSEISANIARYDGIKYGYCDSRGKDLTEIYSHSREKGLGVEVKRRIMLGTYALSQGFYEAYYLKAQKARTLIKQDFDKAFEKVDVLMTPVSPSPAFKLGEKVEDPLSMYLCDVFTGSLSLAGLPAISVPCGKINDGSTDSPQGLPVGLQIIGKPFEENKILAIGKLLESKR